MIIKIKYLLAGGIAVLLLGATAMAAESPPGNRPDKMPAWQAPSAEQVKAPALRWLESKKADEAIRAKAAALWASLPGDAPEAEVLARLAATFALADSQAAQLVQLCSQPRKTPTLPSQVWLADPKTAPLEANNLRLFYGRWLVQQRLLDEGMVQLSGLKPAGVVAPAALVFYQAVVHYRLLDREAGLAAIQELLNSAATSPRRYVAVAQLMQEDLKRLQDDSLDHIARRMDDIHRRLDLGHAGPKVRKVEDGVIESLDKLIKKIEEQQQAAAAATSNNIQSSSPAQDSRIIGGKGPGEVTKRNIGNKSGWGDLPPKDREQALQQIGRDFPSHYRDVIEQYFRRLATEGKDER